MGDIDLDGHADLAVGGFPSSGTREGLARVFSGADGSVIRTHHGGGGRIQPFGRLAAHALSVMANLSVMVNLSVMANLPD